MTARLRAFGRFWYDFVIGDDWSVAVGVVIALSLIAVVSRAHVPSWWILPIVVGILLPFSVWRATRALRREESTG
jgi:hypothetical protein